MYDPQQRGFISGQDAKALFIKTGLPKENLKNIWNLADGGQKGYLSKAEFLVALHLMTLAKNN